MNIKYLDKTLRKNTYDYTVIFESQRYRIYSQISEGNIVGYEVGKRKYRAPSTFLGDSLEYDKVEKFWGDEDFGICAFTYKTEQEAINKLKQIKTRKGYV